jgi:hypothetical protein
MACIVSYNSTILQLLATKSAVPSAMKPIQTRGFAALAQEYHVHIEGNRKLGTKLGML